jgi:TM2 domain-containing membrane protein YozV
MQLTCRRCNGTFTVAGASPTPCPACGSIDVYAQQTMRSPMAKTTERPLAAFSAPVSQPVSPMPPSAITPYAPQQMQHSPSYPAPPPQYSQQQQAPWAPPAQYAQPQYQQYPQPVQVVIQNHVAPMPYAAPYAMAPYVRRKDAGVATLLSFFVPGAGQIYNGQVGKGLGFLLVSLFINFPLMFIGVGFITGLITWIWAMIDAHSSAEKINRGEIIV